MTRIHWTVAPQKWVSSYVCTASCMQQNVLFIKYYFGQHQDRRESTVYDSVEPDQSTAASPIALQAVPRSTGLLWSQEARVEGPMFSVNVPAIWLSTGYSLLIRETSFQCISISHCYLQRSLIVVAGEPLFHIFCRHWLLSNPDSLEDSLLALRFLVSQKYDVSLLLNSFYCAKAGRTSKTRPSCCVQRHQARHRKYPNIFSAIVCHIFRGSPRRWS